MSEPTKKVLKKNNLADNKRMFSRLDLIVMGIDELKQLVPKFKNNRRGRPSKADYITEIMTRQAEQRASQQPIRDTSNETKDEGILQETKNGELPPSTQPRVRVITKEQEEGKRRYTINGFNQVKEEAFNIGSEADFKVFVEKLKKAGQYPSQRGRISETVYRQYITYRKANPINRKEEETKQEVVKATKKVATKVKKVVEKKSVFIPTLTIKSSYDELITEAKRLKYKSSTGKKPSKEALLKFFEDYKQAKKEAEELGFVQVARKGRNTSILPIKDYLEFIHNSSFISIDKNTTQEKIDNLKIEFTENTFQKNRKYKTKATQFQITKKVKIDSSTPMNIIEKLLDKFIEKIRIANDLKDNDKIAFELITFDGRDSLPQPFKKLSEFNGNRIATQIANLLNSNESISIDGCSFVFSYIKDDRGGAHFIFSNITDEQIAKKRCFIQIKNNDNSCFVIALSVAIAQLNKKKGNITESKFKDIVKNCCRPKWIKEYQKLYTAIGMEVDTQVSISDIHRFEKLLKTTINILNTEGHRYPVDLDNQFEDQVYLFLHNNHYIVITSPEAFLNLRENKKFCNGCKKGVSISHKCETKGSFVKNRCLRCGEVHQNAFGEIRCSDCNRVFVSDECFNNHKKPSKKGGKSICHKIFICKSCEVICHKKITEDEYKSIRERLWHKRYTYEDMTDEEYKTAIKKNFQRTHFCGKIWCSACKEHVSIENHQCYIGNLNEKEKQRFKPTNNTIFYDYETFTNEQGEHIPNLVVAFRTNHEDINDYTEHIFSVYQPENELKSVNTRFCEWLFSNDNKGYTCIAHNSKGYDIHFIKQYLYNNDVQLKFDCIDTGSKSMSLKVKALNMRFIDSLNFFGSSLKSLPKTYGLDADIKKGDFPHFFNKPENYNYMGPYPSKLYYGYSSMKKDSAKEFDEWYNNIGDKQFDFKTEIIEYCRNDVLVLMQAWLKFRNIFITITKELSQEKFGDDSTCIDPTKFITLASLCNAIYRCYFMPEKSIAILKENNTNYSISELEWLLYEEKERNISLERQVKIGDYDVDGFHRDSNIVFEFNGCYFHGCRQCFHRDIVNKQNGKTMDIIYNQWITKKTFLESEGYTIVEMWSHTWEAMKKSDKGLKQFLNENKHRCIAPNCSIRDSFFGGRTEVFDLYAKSTADKKIGYADFTSLYPSVQAIESFPIGHPTRIREFNNLNINYFYGFIYCKVKSNENLRIPVLAEKSDTKLIFSHGTKIGVWNSEELKLAVQYGYEILELYEVIHFEERSNNLFADYIRVFFKIKAECSFKGKTDADKDAYIADLNSGRFPVKLDRTKLAFNEGFRQVAKLCLNTLWGKFGQRNNMTQTVIIKNDVNRFNRIMFDDNIEVSSVNFLNEDTVEMKFSFISQCVEQSKNTNIAIASFTTAHARRWLYGAMAQVGFDNVIYCDTDSLIYYHPTGNNTIQTDSKLGGMTDELDGDYIQEIVALAPKTYTYIKSSGKQELKAKGFSINNSSVEQGLKFDTFKTIINQVANQDETLTKKEITYESRIRLNGNSKRIFSQNEKKTFQYTFNKRVIDYENSDENRLTTIPITV